MDEVVADAVAAVGVVAPGVDGADVTGLQRDMVNLIELDQVVVAIEQNRAVGMVVDEIMRRALAYAPNEHCRHVTFGPAALAREVAVLDKMPASPKRLPVSAVQRDAAVAAIEDVAAHDRSEEHTSELQSPCNLVC